MLVIDAIPLESALVAEAMTELTEGACEMLGKDSVGASVASEVGSSEKLGKLSVGASVREGPRRCQM